MILSFCRDVPSLLAVAPSPSPGMKVKELDVTANLAWSPDAVSPVYLATGTAAQQLDATFRDLSHMTSAIFPEL